MGKPPTTDESEDSQALSSLVYDHIRAGIIAGRYSAGQRLSERDISDELSVSRVPIRAALPRLEVGGFVRILPRRSAVVTHITPRDVEELYDLRSVLEPLIARSAATRVAAGADPQPVVDALAASQAALDAADFTALDHSNTHLHHTILELADNALLDRTFGPLSDRVDRLSGVTIESNPAVRHHEHVALAQAIASGHPQLAEASAYTHVELGRARTLAALPTHPHFAPDPEA